MASRLAVFAFHQPCNRTVVVRLETLKGIGRGFVSRLFSGLCRSNEEHESPFSIADLCDGRYVINGLKCFS
jgi:hypothetical protein